VRHKRSTPGREKRLSLETRSENYKTASVQFRDSRARGVSLERPVLLQTAFEAGIRVMSPTHAPRSVVVAVRADVSAKSNEDVWSEHLRLWSSKFVFTLCRAGFLGFFIAPPISRPSTRHDSTLSHPFLSHPPLFIPHPSSLRPPSCPWPTASPPRLSPLPCPCSILDPCTNALFLADLCVSSCQRSFINSCDHLSVPGQ